MSSNDFRPAARPDEVRHLWIRENVSVKVCVHAACVRASDLTHVILCPLSAQIIPVTPRSYQPKE